MKMLVATIVVAFLLGFAGFGPGIAFGQGYAVPTVVQSYYPVAPGYTYTPGYVYPVPMVAPARRVVYAPVVAAPVVVSPRIVAPSPVVVTSPVVVALPVVIGPTGKIYIPGRPVRNVVRAVVP